jgi:hypothetical protein
MADFTAQINGMKRLKSNLASRSFVEYLTWPAIRQTGEAGVERMRQTVPVWKGGLRRSLGQVNNRTELETSIGHVRSVPVYAQYMEYGTGIWHLDERYASAPRQIYWPPPKYLTAWATSKGMPAYAVSKAIFDRGGLLPRRYVQSGALRAQEYIDRALPHYFNSFPEIEVSEWRR